MEQMRTEMEKMREEIKTLQQVVFSQEFDLTELHELRENINKLQNTLSCLCKTVGKDGQATNEECCSMLGSMRKQIDAPNNNNLNGVQSQSVLYQNVPNPFSSNTEIAFNIPAINTSAFIYVYNLQGVELKSFSIKQAGYSTVMISASELPAGMYLYTLVVDNEIIDTKRMILTK
jgi:hypothetical protein